MNQSKIIAKIYIDYCQNCQYHKWCTHHQQSKYLEHFKISKYKQTVQEKLQTKFPIKVQKINLKQNNSLIGKFQIYFQDVQIFSKHKQREWPHIENYFQKIDEMLEVYQKQKQLTKFKQPLKESQFELMQKFPQFSKYNYYQCCLQKFRSDQKFQKFDFSNFQNKIHPNLYIKNKSVDKNIQEQENKKAFLKKNKIRNNNFKYNNNNKNYNSSRPQTKNLKLSNLDNKRQIQTSQKKMRKNNAFINFNSKKQDKDLNQQDQEYQFNRKIQLKNDEEYQAQNNQFKQKSKHINQQKQQSISQQILQSQDKQLHQKLIKQNQKKQQIKMNINNSGQFKQTHNQESINKSSQIKQSIYKQQQKYELNSKNQNKKINQNQQKIINNNCVLIQKFQNNQQQKNQIHNNQQKLKQKNRENTLQNKNEFNQNQKNKYILNSQDLSNINSDLIDCIKNDNKFNDLNNIKKLQQSDNKNQQNKILKTQQRKSKSGINYYQFQQALNQKQQSGKQSNFKDSKNQNILNNYGQTTLKKKKNILQQIETDLNKLQYKINTITKKKMEFQLENKNEMPKSQDEGKINYNWNQQNSNQNKMLKTSQSLNYKYLSPQKRIKNLKQKLKQKQKLFQKMQKQNYEEHRQKNSQKLKLISKTPYQILKNNTIFPFNNKQIVSSNEQRNQNMYNKTKKRKYMPRLNQEQTSKNLKQNEIIIPSNDIQHKKKKFLIKIKSSQEKQKSLSTEKQFDIQTEKDTFRKINQKIKNDKRNKNKKHKSKIINARNENQMQMNQNNEKNQQVSVDDSKKDKMYRLKKIQKKQGSKQNKDYNKKYNSKKKIFKQNKQHSQSKGKNKNQQQQQQQQQKDLDYQQQEQNQNINQNQKTTIQKNNSQKLKLKKNNLNKYNKTKEKFGQTQQQKEFIQKQDIGNTFNQNQIIANKRYIKQKLNPNKKNQTSIKKQQRSSEREKIDKKNKTKKSKKKSLIKMIEEFQQNENHLGQQKNQKKNKLSETKKKSQTNETPKINQKNNGEKNVKKIKSKQIKKKSEKNLNDEKAEQKKQLLNNSKNQQQQQEQNQQIFYPQQVYSRFNNNEKKQKKSHQKKGKNLGFEMLNDNQNNSENQNLLKQSQYKKDHQQINQNQFSQTYNMLNPDGKNNDAMIQNTIQKQQSNKSKIKLQQYPIEMKSENISQFTIQKNQFLSSSSSFKPAKIVPFLLTVSQNQKLKLRLRFQQKKQVSKFRLFNETLVCPQPQEKYPFKKQYPFPFEQAILLLLTISDKLITRLFQNEGVDISGVFGVWLFFYGEWKMILVNNKVTEQNQQFKWIPVLVAAIEQIAKKNIKDMKLNQILSILTGVPNKILKIKQKKSNIIKIINNSTAQNQLYLNPYQMMFVFSDRLEKKKNQYNFNKHISAFRIHQCKEYKTQNGKIQLLGMQTVIKLQQKYKGQFWMTEKDFSREFQIFLVINISLNLFYSNIQFEPSFEPFKNVFSLGFNFEQGGNSVISIISSNPSKQQKLSLNLYHQFEENKYEFNGYLKGHNQLYFIKKFQQGNYLFFLKGIKSYYRFKQALDRVWSVNIISESKSRFMKRQWLQHKDISYEDMKVLYMPIIDESQTKSFSKAKSKKHDLMKSESISLMKGKYKSNLMNSESIHSFVRDKNQRLNYIQETESKLQNN